MKELILILALACTSPASAQDALPALFGVTGVAANDVLNVRTSPDAGSAVLGSLPPHAAEVEVVALSPDGKWGLIGRSEGAGWVAMQFLARNPGPDWTSLQAPLSCYGTEPFWLLRIDPAAGKATYTTPVNGERRLSVDWHAPVFGAQRSLGIHLTNAGAPAFVTITGDACSDGMSDREFGLSATYFLTSETGSEGFAGCCTLTR